MQRTIVLLACVLLSALAAACDGGSDAAPPAATSRPERGSIIVAPEESLVIGLSVALSGEQTELGKDLVAAAELAAGEFGGSVRGFDIEIVARDDGCTDAEKTIDIAGEFIADDALAGVVGPMCTTGAQAANRRYEAAAVVHISPSATRAQLSAQGAQYFFRTVWADDAQARVQAQYAVDELGAASAVLIDDGDPYGNTLADAFAREYESREGRIIARERIARGTTDFAPLARQITDSGAQAVVYEGLNPEGALIAKALMEAGFAGSFIGTDALLNVRDFVGTAGAGAEGAIVTGGATPDLAFVETYIALYGRPPVTQFVLQTHDAVTALLKAVETAAVERDDDALVIERAALAGALREQRFAGRTGSITFDERGDRRGETPGELGLSVYRVVNGSFQQVQ